MGKRCAKDTTAHAKIGNGGTAVAQAHDCLFFARRKFDAPFIHGVVPGHACLVSSSSSLEKLDHVHCHDRYYTNSPLQTSILSHTAASHTHTMPAMSAMVTLQHTTDYNIAYLPPGFKVLLLISLATVALASCWAVLVLLVNFPPGGWGIWRWRGWGRKREDRPADKPSRYGRVGVVGRRGDGCEGGLEMRRRSRWDDGGLAASSPSVSSSSSEKNRSSRRIPTNDKQQRNPPSSKAPPSSSYSQPSLMTRRSNTMAPRSPPRSTSTISSPPNPFLKPPVSGSLATHTYNPEPLVPRTSREWLAERAAFFSCYSSSTSHVSCGTPYAPATSSGVFSTSPSSSTHTLPLNALEALESGTAPLLTRTPSYSSTRSAASGDGVGDKGVLERSLSWVDEGLGMLDGVVERVAGGLARWAVEGDGGVELGLPVARERRRERERDVVG
ncbi:predicted protein [Plenodomus lingam JN3]|uniref:Predicted protein n=1 Tax=Leptosphaeria maculans (strain JN3 / isolate v23.1.3 / race Av1-4-5-6-7-8) TaxID=985895 RepID=E5AER0_LEPMJ|nr:predicted protein [Plenodomus lingam JN3]CBY01699.1 predicted protein [Plenodomus lingam JN3]